MMVPRRVDMFALAGSSSLATAPTPAARTTAASTSPAADGRPTVLRNLFGHDTFETHSLYSTATRKPSTPETRLGLDVGRWGQPVAQENGITLWKVADKPLPAFRAEGDIAAPIDMVVASIVDINEARPWLGCIDAGTLARDPITPGQSKVEALWYMTGELPYVGERLALFKTSLQLHPQSRQVEIVTRILGEDEMNAALAAHGGRVDPQQRAKMQSCGDVKKIQRTDVCMLLTALPDGTTRMTVSMRLDPNVRGLSLLPDSITEGAPRGAALDQIRSVRKRLGSAALFEPAHQEIARMIDWSVMGAAA